MDASKSFSAAVLGMLGAWTWRSEGSLFSLNQPKAHAHPTQHPAFPFDPGEILEMDGHECSAHLE